MFKLFLKLFNTKAASFFIFYLKKNSILKMSDASLNVSQLKLALHILDRHDILESIHICASYFGS